MIVTIPSRQEQTGASEVYCSSAGITGRHIYDPRARPCSATAHLFGVCVWMSNHLMCIACLDSVPILCFISREGVLVERVPAACLGFPRCERSTISKRVGTARLRELRCVYAISKGSAVKLAASADASSAHQGRVTILQCEPQFTPHVACDLSLKAAVSRDNICRQRCGSCGILASMAQKLSRLRKVVFGNEKQWTRALLDPRAMKPQNHF